MKQTKSIFYPFFSTLLIAAFFTVSLDKAYAMTLQEAMNTAVEKHLRLKIGETEIDSAKGELMEMKAYAYNPEVSIEPQKRYFRGREGSYTDYYVGLSQGIETGGKRSYREAIARNTLKAQKEGFEMSKLLVQINVASDFVALSLAEKRLTVRKKQLDMAKRLLDAVEKQVNVGEASELQANLVRTSLATALSSLQLEKMKFQQLEGTLKVALLLRPTDGIKIKLVLPALNLDWDPSTIGTNELKTRPDLLVAESMEKAADEKRKLASANKIPDITVSLMAGNEAGDRLYKFGVSIPIPLFNSHSGAYRKSVAQKHRAELEKEFVKLQINTEVETAFKNHRSAMDTLKSYRKNNLGTAENNAQLAQEAFEKGELDLVDVIVHINQSLEAELTGIELLHQAWGARIGLSEALGQPRYLFQ